MSPRLATALMTALLAGCEVNRAPPATADTASVAADSLPGDATAASLIDPGQVAATASDSGWNYRRTAEIDVDADGATEKVVMMAPYADSELLCTYGDTKVSRMMNPGRV